jgi:hypothetical protein
VVFVHVGTMQSCTSYLQTLCDCNMDLLAQSGVFVEWSDLNFLAMGICWAHDISDRD